MKELKSFLCAFRGISDAIKSEAHLRFHLMATFYVVIFAALGKFTSTQWVLLTLTISSVICAELVNTATERLCDLYSCEKCEKIRFIKDVAAGAVLVTAIGAAIVAVILFLIEGKLALGFEKLLSSPRHLVTLGLSLIFWIVFLIQPLRKHKNKD